VTSDKINPAVSRHLSHVTAASAAELEHAQNRNGAAQFDAKKVKRRRDQQFAQFI